MRSTGGRRARGARSGTPVAVGFAALVATLLLAACSGDASPSRTSESAVADQETADRTASPSASPGGTAQNDVDPRAARIASLLRRLQLSWTDDTSYIFTTRAVGGFNATARGRGTWQSGKVQQLSGYRIRTTEGVDDLRFAVNATTSSILATGLPPERSRAYRPFNPLDISTIEAIFGPGVDGMPYWTGSVSGVADRITGLDLDPDGTGEKVSFRLPTDVWVPRQGAVPPQVARTTEFTLTFEGQKVVRIEAVRDDTVINTIIAHAPYKKIRLPAASYRGP